METNGNSYEFDRNALNDDSVINSLTEEHLEIHNSFELHKSNPEYYRDTKHLEYVGAELVLLSRINLDKKVVDDNGNNIRTQEARRTHYTPTQQRKLHDSFADRGIVLSEKPPQTFDNEDGTDDYITGMSRDVEFKNYNFKYIIVGRWRAKKGSTQTEIEHDKQYLGLLFNPEGLPSVPASQFDLIAFGTRQVISKYLKHDYQEIYDEMRPLCKNAGYGVNKTSYIVNVIMQRSNKSGTGIVIPMLAQDAKDFMTRNKYIDVPGRLKWKVMSYDRCAQALEQSIQMAVKNPSCEIRLVVHPGVLGGDPSAEYDKRIGKFYSDMDKMISNLSQIIFGNAEQRFKNWSLYGAIPSVGNDHNLKRLNVFDQEAGDGSFIEA